MKCYFHAYNDDISIETKQGLYLSFLDYTKSFDKVHHEKLFKILVMHAHE